MFIIAGIQPRTRRLDDNPRTCPHCGSAQAVAQRTDHYFSLFFIPLIKVKTGSPFVVCPRCQGHSASGPGLSIEGARPSPVPTAALAQPCPACGRTVEPAFRYCPHCGQRVRAG